MSIIKKFQERMQSDALMLHIVWKMGFFKQFTGFWDFPYQIFIGIYGPSIVCCLYTQFDVFKIFLEHMEDYALVMRYAWKMDFLKKNIEFSGDFHI